MANRKVFEYQEIRRQEEVYQRLVQEDWCNMSETLFERRGHGDTMRVHDYLYDSAFIVSGARDYARAAFKAAMASAQVNIQPLYKTMFSNLKTAPSAQVVYHPNCRLPSHLDRSYEAYVTRIHYDHHQPTPELAGKDRYRFAAKPKKLLPMASVTPQLRPPSAGLAAGDSRPKNKGTQSRYRESSAQTVPWQPPGKKAAECENTPEVLYLDALEWGPGKPFRLGDLPADFHTTEIINKMRHARTWNSVVESGEAPRWMKKRDNIISDVETRDWIFREAEIDELQDIRLELLHKLQKTQRTKQTARTVKKLANLWAEKKMEVERRVDTIRKTRDRELRKLAMAHEYGRDGLVNRIRGARGGGSVTFTAAEPTSDLHAPLARHGYQARRRHAEIYYDPSLLAYEDHEKLSKPPEWLDQCGQNLRKTCSGHHLPRDPMQLCERETKWSEEFLEKLHNDLKKARLGAGGGGAGPLRVLKPRNVVDIPRPSTPEVDGVQDIDEICHQAALTLQRIIRGRAVQTLMYEGRTRAAELTTELKTTHGLQKEDKIHIAKEEARARDFHVMQTQANREENAVATLVDELCGSTVSAALDFLEKELRRLKQERRQHAFLLIAIREKVMREAAEAGRRQKEEQRRHEHDEMFKQIVGVTQETVDAYLHDVIVQGVELGVEEAAVRRAERKADEIDKEMKENESMSTAEQNELVAELVQQFLLPEAHKCASRHRVAALQQARTEAARKTIFGLLDEAETPKEFCVRCGEALDELCRCRSCKVAMEPVETKYRHDPRWKHTTSVPVTVKTTEQRYPPAHEIRCLLNAIVDDAVVEAKERISARQEVWHECFHELRERLECQLEARDLLHLVIDLATGATTAPAKKREDYAYVMRIIRKDAIEREKEYAGPPPPTELPSEIRAREVAEMLRLDPRCHCVDEAEKSVQFSPELDKTKLLPSELRELEELKRCKCDAHTPAPSSEHSGSPETESGGEHEDAPENRDDVEPHD